jgi:SPP1 family predicted phage head-tail adaptor
MTTISDFNRKANIKTRRKVSNNRGGWTWKEIDLGDFWCSRTPLSTDKKIQFQQADVEASYRYYFHFDYRVDESSVITDGESKFFVQSILPPESSNDFFMEVLVNGEPNRE